MAPIWRGESNRICHHQWVDPGSPFQAWLGSNENRSWSIAPTGPKPAELLEAETASWLDRSGLAVAAVTQAISRTARGGQSLRVGAVVRPRRVREEAAPKVRTARADSNCIGLVENMGCFGNIACWKEKLSWIGSADEPNFAEPTTRGGPVWCARGGRRSPGPRQFSLWGHFQTLSETLSNPFVDVLGFFDKVRDKVSDKDSRCGHNENCCLGRVRRCVDAREAGR